jgi:hypothetical protein
MIMQRLFMFFSFFGLSATANATVDGHDRVFLVVQDVQSEQFFMERAPMLGCYGLPQGARLGAWVLPYKVPTNIGCGGEPVYTEINALACAKIVDSKENADYSGFSEVVLDISQCPYKDNAQFITMVRTTAKYNFPQPKGSKEVRLILKK